MSVPPSPAIKLAMSMPEHKLLPSPCSTTARTEVSSASSSATFIRPSNMAWSSALCLSARTIVTVATPLAPIRTRTLSSLTRRNLPRHEPRLNRCVLAQGADQYQSVDCPTAGTNLQRPASSVVELPGIEPGSKILLNCGNSGTDDAK